MTARRPFIERHSCLKELAANTAFPSTCKRETKPISRYRCKCCKRRLMEATKASSARRQEGTYCTTSNESAIEMKRSCSRNMVQRASPEFPVLGAGSLLLLLESLNDSIPRAPTRSAGSQQQSSVVVEPIGGFVRVSVSSGVGRLPAPQRRRLVPCLRPLVLCKSFCASSRLISGILCSSN